MRKPITRAASVALLAMSLAGCVTAQGTTTVPEARAALCPQPLTRDELLRAADALDHLPAGEDLDALAGYLDRLDEGARICRGAV